MTLAVASRAEQVIDELAERELDALLVNDLTNVRWVAGFTGTNGLALVGRDVRAFITDFRYVEQAQAQVPDTFERVRGKQDLIGDAVERMRGKVGYDDAHMTVRQLRRLEGLVAD